MESSNCPFNTCDPDDFKYVAHLSIKAVNTINEASKNRNSDI